MSFLEITGLHVSRGVTEVVRGVDLDVERGEILLMLGANGAGKSSTMLAVAGVLRATAGTIQLGGSPLPGGSPQRHVRAGLALVPENRGLFHQLTVLENLQLRARGNTEAIAEAMSPFPALADLTTRRVGLLSGGEQQMLAVACALSLRPRALLVDELTLGLAPLVVARLLAALRSIADGGTAVLLVEQHVHAALAVADRCVVLQRGQIVHRSDAASVRDDPEVIRSAYLG
jgi:branched-chain amino acid transport system ATP-binding protein